MRFSKKARISAASVSTLSLTPFSSTDWLTRGMPASTSRASAARRRGRKFSRMIGMDRHPAGDAGRQQRGDEIVADAFGIHHRHAGMPADDFDMRDGGQPAGDLFGAARRLRIKGSPPVRITSSISGWACDIGEGAVEILRRQRVAPCPARSFRGGSRSGNRPGSATPP